MLKGVFQAEMSFRNNSNSPKEIKNIVQGNYIDKYKTQY